jgi:hypothetical protein
MNALAIDQMPSVLLPCQPMPRFLRSIDFAALPTAITCTRLFVAGLPIRTPKPTPHPRPPATPANHPRQNLDFLRQVLAGLQGL